jgi:hypothetical protein
VTEIPTVTGSGRFGVVLEALQPHRSAFTICGGRPPRLPVVGRERRKRGVDVGRDRVHLVFAEQSAHVQEAGLGEEVGQVLVVVLGRERVTEVEGLAVAVAEVDCAARMRRPGVEERTQHDPPVEKVFEPAARQVEVTTAEKTHRRADVVHQVGEVLLVEAHDGGRAAVAGRHRHDVVVERECPRPTGDLDAQRGCAELTATRHREVSVAGTEVGQGLVEEDDRVDGDDVVVGPRSQIH